MIKVGDKVMAMVIITEAGGDQAPNPDAKDLKDPGWVHARPGDEGVVEYVDSDGEATVRFQPSGTATVVGGQEIG